MCVCLNRGIYILHRIKNNHKSISSSSKKSYDVLYIVWHVLTVHVQYTVLVYTSKRECVTFIVTLMKPIQLGGLFFRCYSSRFYSLVYQKNK